MVDIIFVDKPLSLAQLKKIAEQRFGDMVKAVVDLRRKIMAVGGELHADEEAFLLQQGSTPGDLWGVNIYPDLAISDRLEFDSMINIRPSQNNHSRSVEDSAVREQIATLVNSLVLR